MPKTINNKKSSRKKVFAPVEGDSGLPERMRKDGCLYIDGELISGAHGTFHVSLENGMDCICTARKMEALKVYLLQGDKCVIEIPAVSMSPTETLRGRIIWRHRYLNQN